MYYLVQRQSLADGRKAEKAGKKLDFERSTRGMYKYTETKSKEK